MHKFFFTSVGPPPPPPPAWNAAFAAGYKRAALVTAGTQTLALAKRSREEEACVFLVLAPSKKGLQEAKMIRVRTILTLTVKTRFF